MQARLSHFPLTVRTVVTAIKKWCVADLVTIRYDVALGRLPSPEVLKSLSGQDLSAAWQSHPRCNRSQPANTPCQFRSADLQLWNSKQTGRINEARFHASSGEQLSVAEGGSRKQSGRSAMGGSITEESLE